MHDKGIVSKLNNIFLWETVIIKPDVGGVTSYVTSFQNYTLTKGSKSINVRFLIIDDIKDGKQVEEWLRYDNSGIAELMK